MQKKICKCGKLINFTDKYCDKCSIETKADNRIRNQMYDRYQRNSDAVDFYNSQDWIKTREYALSRFNYLDIYSFFIEKKIEYANTVHHIEELEDNWDKRLDIDNLIPLTSSNHNKIHGRYNKDKEGTQFILRQLIRKWYSLYGSEG